MSPQLRFEKFASYYTINCSTNVRTRAHAQARAPRNVSECLVIDNREFVALVIVHHRMLDGTAATSGAARRWRRTLTSLLRAAAAAAAAFAVAGDARSRRLKRALMSAFLFDS